MRQHVPVLDGLRGVAIALVMVAHLTSRTLTAALPLPFGFLEQLGQSGVDLFFVLSGLLITGILLDTRDDPRRVRNFAARRLLRIVPAFYAVLVFFGVLLPAFFPEGNSFSKTWLSAPLAQAVFLSNVHYFSLGRFPLEPMSVSWSLAVEAQFYLLWPILCWGVPVSRLRSVLVGLLLAAPVVRLAMASFGANDMQIYVLTPARLDAFAAGALVALAQRGAIKAQIVRWFGERTASLALVISVGAVASQALAFTWPALSPYLSAYDYSALAVLYALLVSACLAPERPTMRRAVALLSTPLMRRLGLYSFAVFLTNLAVAEGLRLAGVDLVGVLGEIPGQVVFYPVGAAVCVLVGAAVYHLIEAPCRRFNRYFATPTKYVQRDGAQGSDSLPVSQVNESPFLS